MVKMTDFNEYVYNLPEEKRKEEEALKRQRAERILKEKQEKEKRRKELLEKLNLRNRVREFRQRRRDKQEEKARLEEEDRERKKRVVEEIKICFAKINDAYSRMEGNYIREGEFPNLLQIVKDKNGNIFGLVDGYAFASNEKREVHFYSKPVVYAKEIHAGPHWSDTEKIYTYDYATALVRLRGPREFDIPQVNIHLKETSIYNYEYEKIKTKVSEREDAERRKVR